MIKTLTEEHLRRKFRRSDWEDGRIFMPFSLWNSMDDLKKVNMARGAASWHKGSRNVHATAPLGAEWIEVLAEAESPDPWIGREWQYRGVWEKHGWYFVPELKMANGQYQGKLRRLPGYGGETDSSDPFGNADFSYALYEARWSELLREQPDPWIGRAWYHHDWAPGWHFTPETLLANGRHSGVLANKLTRYEAIDYDMCQGPWVAWQEPKPEQEAEMRSEDTQAETLGLAEAIERSRSTGERFREFRGDGRNADLWEATELGFVVRVSDGEDMLVSQGWLEARYEMVPEPKAEVTAARLRELARAYYSTDAVAEKCNFTDYMIRELKL